MGIGLALLVCAVVAFLLTRPDAEPAAREEGGLRFAEPDAPAADFAEVVTPDAVDPALVTRFDVPVVVAAGDGPRSERIELDPPANLLPAEPGAVVAGVARAGGDGRLILVGPDGWLDGACVLAQTTSAQLRPLSSLHFAATTDSCGLNPVGQPAEVICRGDNAVILSLDIPQGAVALPEGGTGFADSVRLQLVGAAEGYETMTIRGAIDVADDSVIDVPEVGGPPGAEVTVVLGGAGARATCTFTS